MELGAFSVSLAVKDLAASKRFYEKLGFRKMHGDESANWVILQSGTTVIGLFQGLFESNILTFNPGWDQNAQALEAFTDVRQIQATLDEEGVAVTTRTDPDGTGVGHIVLEDPDGNVIMLDQHVPKG